MTDNPETPDEPTTFEITGTTDSDGTVGAGDHDEDVPRTEAFRYADLTDNDLVELLGARGIDPSEARSAIAAARSWPGRERDEVTAAVEAAVLAGADGADGTFAPAEPTSEQAP